MKISIHDLIDTLPDHSWKVDPDEIDRQRGDRVVIVLDDDPTGTQTVCQVPVLTEWSLPAILREFESGIPLFYILTNTRSVPGDQAVRINREITGNILKVSRRLNRPFLLISRSDSTLRGHFPLETEAIAGTLGLESYTTVLNPAFFEGGRLTIGNHHYVREGDYLIPAEETAYARDEVFGFSSGNLYDYVMEKSNGTISRDDIYDLDIAMLRTLSLQQITEKILDNRHKKLLIINAADYEDERKAVLALLKAADLGVNLIFRTAASIVPVIGGIRENPLLQQQDLNRTSAGGLIVVGSYVDKTNRQLEELLKSGNVVPIEIDVGAILGEDVWREDINMISQRVNRLVRDGRDVVIYTSRDLRVAEKKQQNLEIGKTISEGLVGIIRHLHERPSFIIGKGGITSSDIATHGLGIRRAVVRGQIIPGVPVWRLGNESKFPGLDYVVFPGNVGDDHALSETCKKFRW